MAKRRGSDSRCCDPGGGALTWRDYEEKTHPSLVSLNAWLAQLAPFARAHELGEIDELMEAAAQGQLWDSADETTPIKPIREDPEIFELRRTSLSKKLRFYHGEPVEMPAHLVRLHRHIKDGKSSQQIEIEHAAKRYDDGRQSSWG